MKITAENWKEVDINVDSLWLISERDKSGKHANVYHGNFVPQIPRQLITRYTEEQELVLEFFMGSGTSLFECENLNRRYIGFDINTQIIDYVQEKMQGSTLAHHICNCSVLDKAGVDASMLRCLGLEGQSYVDFMIAHPPYLDIVKFTEHKDDLSNISDVDVFVEQVSQALGNGLRYLKKGGYFALVMGDVYKNREVIPLGFYTMQKLRDTFALKLKGTIVKNIEGNRGKLGASNIWRYRALRSDYYIFKHEYIFVFKKEY